MTLQLDCPTTNPPSVVGAAFITPAWPILPRWRKGQAGMMNAAPTDTDRGKGSL
ncbi:MAG TPA: hypothetical protein VFA10_13065 [Ktedonobacteraceae bacterium]|nr:hypothetical protein [Ktedonobacteraceae bacterium]